MIHQTVFGSFALIFIIFLVLSPLSTAIDGYESEELHGVVTDSITEGAIPVEKQLKNSQHQYNEDEFVGYDTASLQTPKKSTDKKDVKNDNEKQVEEFLPPPKTNYYLEIFYLGFILLYIINFFMGRRKNDQIATMWASEVKKSFLSNFSKVGEGKNGIVVKETQNRYVLKATGRQYTIGLQATLELRKRHDLFSMILELFWPAEDTLTVDVLMDDTAMDTYVFALIRKKDEKKFRKNAEDVASFTSGSVSISGLPSSLCVTSECEELIGTFLSTEVVSTLSKFENIFRRMHFSDQGVSSTTHKKSLQFVFKVPNQQLQMEGIVIFTRMVFYFIDLVPKVNLSKQGKQKAINHRSKIAEKASKVTHEQRQEAAQQRKLEKVQKEKEKLAMSPEALAKFEEKLKKKEMKRRMPKMKVTVS